jgi:hypothetical protein
MNTILIYLGVLKYIYFFCIYMKVPIGNPSIGVYESSGAQEFFRVPPVGRASSAATCTQDAFIEAIEWVSLTWFLFILFSLWRWLLGLKPWLY